MGSSAGSVLVANRFISCSASFGGRKERKERPMVMAAVCIACWLPGCRALAMARACCCCCCCCWCCCSVCDAAGAAVVPISRDNVSCTSLSSFCAARCRLSAASSIFLASPSSAVCSLASCTTAGTTSLPLNACSNSCMFSVICPAATLAALPLAPPDVSFRFVTSFLMATILLLSASAPRFMPVGGSSNLGAGFGSCLA
mmetsp:Transcript_15708/g.23079  ORF Transcript_15708/g.23079 Transcript_15708/m.23079 type:complete len:200 (-) Transcript_15708:827-1426(-)